MLKIEYLSPLCNEAALAAGRKEYFCYKLNIHLHYAVRQHWQQVGGSFLLKNEYLSPLCNGAALAAGRKEYFCLKN